MILSREIAAKNRYPAIDVLKSLSRVMHEVVGPAHLEAAGQLRRMLARYDEVETLLRIGEYHRGSDRATDEAIDRHDEAIEFLAQEVDRVEDFDDIVDRLQAFAP